MSDTLPAIPAHLGILFRDTVRRYPSKPAFLQKTAGHYEPITWTEFAARVDALASYFLESGIQAGDRIAILSENRVEWALVDIAAQTIGAATVPIYTSLTPHEIEYLLKDSGAAMVAVSNRPFLEKLFSIQDNLPALKKILGFDAALSLSQTDLQIPITLLKDAEKTPVSGRLEGARRAVNADTLASIIYTSGTTGNPKGVLLTHANFIHNAVYCREALKMGPSDIHLSFLPLSHVFERLAGHFLMIHIGATIAYAESMDTVPQNMSEIHPTFLLGVPRFYEKIRAKVEDAVAHADPIRRGLAAWGKQLGFRKRQGRGRGPLFGFQHALASVLVYRTFKRRLGGRVRFCVSGGAPLAKDVAEYFHDLGVLIIEGYGLTETSPVISCNREEKFRFGTVGVPLAQVEVKICDDGEIATKSPCVMKGYYNKPSETTAALIDGWFHTGDLGKIDADGFLCITGRKKELIVTSGGKKVSPRPIEELLEADSLILRVVLAGEGKKFLTALVVPRKEAVLELADLHRIAYSDYAELMENPRIVEAVDGRVQKLMSTFASFEKIKYFVLLENDFTQAAGELTPTLKVKRDVVLAKHQALLAPFYAKEHA